MHKATVCQITFPRIFLAVVPAVRLPKASAKHRPASHPPSLLLVFRGNWSGGASASQEPVFKLGLSYTRTEEFSQKLSVQGGFVDHLDHHQSGEKPLTSVHPIPPACSRTPSSFLQPPAYLSFDLCKTSLRDRRLRFYRLHFLSFSLSLFFLLGPC